MKNEITERYAAGLFELAVENQTLKEKKNQAEAIIQAMDENSDFTVFLRASKITKEEKKNTIDQIFGKTADRDICSFMKLIIDKGRVYYLKGILEEFVRLANEELGIVLVTVVSARELSDEQKETIKDALEKKLNKTILLTNKIDPSVIAGVKVIVGNNVTDVTMQTKIERMRSALLKGGLS